MAKTWQVSYPVAGEVTVIVEADTEAEAIEAGWDKTADPDAELTWEPMEHIVEGNVFNGESNSIWAEEIDDGDDE